MPKTRDGVVRCTHLLPRCKLLQTLLHNLTLQIVGLDVQINLVHVLHRLVPLRPLLHLHIHELRLSIAARHPAQVIHQIVHASGTPLQEIRGQHDVPAQRPELIDVAAGGNGGGVLERGQELRAPLFYDVDAFGGQGLRGAVVRAVLVALLVLVALAVPDAVRRRLGLVAGRRERLGRNGAIK